VTLSEPFSKKTLRRLGEIRVSRFLEEIIRAFVAEKSSFKNDIFRPFSEYLINRFRRGVHYSENGSYSFVLAFQKE
jgi:hypothetical protein